MGRITEILNIAQERATGLPYEGALLPKEAYFLWQNAPGAKIVDVRTRAELDWVGRIPNAIAIEWLTYPTMQPNANFMKQLTLQVDPESLVMFICRSGARSHNAAAAASEAGYAQCYNILEGFEGDRDPKEQRGKLNGWKTADLPWSQG